jgi:hypothetical protein
MAFTIPGTALAPANSTTYIDLLGLLVGLSRMRGETSSAFSQRVRQATVLDRSASYIGILNECLLQFGLTLMPAIALTGPADLTIQADLMGVHLDSETADLHYTTPLVTVDLDNFWVWRALSDVVQDLAAQAGCTATLLVPDGPAFQIARQSNTILAVAEAIDGQTVRLANTGFLPGTESFSNPVGPYSVEENSILSFQSPVPPNTTVTYQFRVSPYALLTSPVFLMNMRDPQLSTLAVGPNGQLVYQCQEFVQDLVSQDASYWAN